jgi:hypothetical protein
MCREVWLVWPRSFLGAVDDVLGDVSLCESAVVCGVGVVVAQVGVGLAFESCVAGVEVAGECWPSVLVGDRLVQCLDVSVGLWSSCVNAGVAHVRCVDGLCEAALELVAVVVERPLQLPAGGLQLPCDPFGKDAGLSGGGVALLADHELRPRLRLGCLREPPTVGSTQRQPNLGSVATPGEVGLPKLGESCLFVKHPPHVSPR